MKQVHWILSMVALVAMVMLAAPPPTVAAPSIANNATIPAIASLTSNTMLAPASNYVHTANYVTCNHATVLASLARAGALSHHNGVMTMHAKRVAVPTTLAFGVNGPAAPPGLVAMNTAHSLAGGGGGNCVLDSARTMLILGVQGPAG